MKKRVTRRGLRVNSIDYFSEALMAYIGQEVEIREKPDGIVVTCADDMFFDIPHPLHYGADANAVKQAMREIRKLGR